MLQTFLRAPHFNHVIELLWQMSYETNFYHLSKHNLNKLLGNVNRIGQKMALSLFSKHFNRNLVIRSPPGLSLLKRNCAAQSAIQKTPKHANTVAYPPIVDQSPKAVSDREKIEWHKKVQDLNTIEEKLIKVNMPAYWGLRTTPLENDEYHYNCLPYFQHWTRTHYEEGLPSNWFKRPTEEVDALINNIRDQIIEAISFQYQGFR